MTVIHAVYVISLIISITNYTICYRLNRHDSAIIKSKLTSLYSYGRDSSYGGDKRSSGGGSSSSWSRGGGGGGSGGGGRSRYGGGGGGGSSYYNKPQDPTAQLRFKKTVKIDPEYQTPVSDMNFSEKTQAVLMKKGFTKMTPVQSQSYDYVYGGDDVVARSRTGTGKTLAFGLPLIEKIIALGLNDPRGGHGLPLILVLEPTRELAMQVAEELSVVCAAHRMRVQSIYGGVSFSMQERAIRSGVHILVATPGRCLDHITRGTVDLSSIKHVVLDEGDTMLEMGFQKDVETIILNVKKPGEASRKVAAAALADFSDEDEDRDWQRSRSSSDNDEENDAEEDDEDDGARSTHSSDGKGGSSVQMLLFSATMPGWICQLTDKHMSSPIFLDAVQEGETRLASTIAQFAVRLPNIADRMTAVSSFVEDLILTKGAGGQTIVFTNTKDEADMLVGSDCFGQLKSQVLHGDISQNSRQATIRQFKEGTIDVLVATDVAARGLDIAGVDLVVHSGPPNDADTYVHRSGRTGRAGRNGTSIVLYTSSEERKLFVFENTLKFKFTRTGPPTPQQISEASALYASKRLQQVNPEVVKYFIPHAQQLIRSLGDDTASDNDDDDDDGFGDDDSEDDEAPAVRRPKGLLMSDEEKKLQGSSDLSLHGSGNPQQLEMLVAKCLAAISNRNTITSRSLLTGQQEYTTLQVEALFKNGSSPDNIRDWQRLITGVFKRSLGVEEFRFGKMSMGRHPSDGRQLIALVDLDFDKAVEVLKLIEGNPLPQGLKIFTCESLPTLVQDRSERDSSYGRGGSSSYGRGGGSSYRGGGSSYQSRGEGGYRGGGDRGGGDSSYRGGGGGDSSYRGGGGGDSSYRGSSSGSSYRGGGGGGAPAASGRTWQRSS